MAMKPIHAEVKLNGLCKKYEANTRPIRIAYGKSIVEMIDNKVDARYANLDKDPKLSSAIEMVVDKKVGEIEITSIIGNRNLNTLKDRNDNKIPDDYETIIVGGEGA